MSEPKPPGLPGFPTPTDDPKPQAVNETPKSVPQRGKRMRVLGDGEGDYCIGELVGPESPMPRGAIIPIPGVPRFEDTRDALKWISHKSGDLLAGKQVMVYRACEVLQITVQSKPEVVIRSKTKTVVRDPSAGPTGEAKRETPSDG